MPVSPQDFALWSNLTGNPYPQTPAERMALAPEVYTFTRNLGRGGGQQMGGVRRAVDVIGKAALAAGALAGAAYLSAEGYKRLQLDDEPGVTPAPKPAANPLGQTSVASGDITPPTTADRYGQDVVPHQTTEVQMARGVSPAKPTVVSSEEKPATQSHVISSSQTFSPGSELEQLSTAAVPHTPVRDRADDLISEFLGMVKGEERQQAQIQKGLDVYAAGVAGRGEKMLKEVLKEGRQEGISPVGMSSVRAAESFRQSPQYAEMMRSAGASTEPEELIGGPDQPTVYTAVRPTAPTRVAESAEESPIVAMVKPAAPEPAKTVTTIITEAPKEEMVRPVAIATTRRTAEQDEQELLARKYLGVVPKTAAVAAPAQTTRVASEGTITPNEFLSKMSQQKGVSESYEIPASRSTAVRGLNIYPGGEIGVSLPTKQGAKEYVYGAADPFRMAVGEYAAEGFPSEMGHLGKIFGYQGVAPGLGLMRGLERGGKATTSSGPLYTGLMSESEIASAMSAPQKTKTAQRTAQRAGYDMETREIMKDLERRAAARRAGI